jgi:hypothetical protein
MSELIKQNKASLYLGYFPQWTRFHEEVKKDIFQFYDFVDRIYRKLLLKNLEWSKYAQMINVRSNPECS